MKNVFFRTWRIALLGLLALPTMAHAQLFWWWNPDPNAARTSATQTTARLSPDCRPLGDFYWEIGNSTARLGSGRVGLRIDANTVVDLASSSKLPFSAYILQRFGAPNDARIEQMTMRSGYMNFNDSLCAVTTTIAGCFNAPSSLLPINSMQSPEEVGRYYYNGGHLQKLAVDAGLGGMTSSALQSDMRTRLGTDTGVAVAFPGVAGGLRMSANGYAVLLRKIMRNELLISSYLGSNRTCTRPATCPSASYSPFSSLDWDYSLGHWIEHEAGGADEAYSSVGLYGFYPWISADRQYYGVLSARTSTVSGASGVACGRKLRTAWMTGIAQY